MADRTFANSTFEVEAFPNGQFSLRHRDLDEPMHSLIGPWNEALAIYIKQSNLAARLRLQSGLGRPLVIYDVGLGLAANALAALEEFEGMAGPRSLHLISFENEISGLQTALENSDRFPFLKRHEALLRQLIRDGEIQRECLDQGSESWFRWTLQQGDFRDFLFSCSIKFPPPDLIYYDFYSPKVCPDLWSLKIFRKLSSLAELRKKEGGSVTLYTYTSSTAVRAALMLSGFYVGRGLSTEGKLETTVASTDRRELGSPLTLEWLEHWCRSSKPLPSDGWPEGLEPYGFC